MRTTIDKAGRVVIPKALREALGLGERTDVEVTQVDGGIVIRPAPVKMRLVRRGRGLVAETDIEMPVLTAEMVREVLEQGRR